MILWCPVLRHPLRAKVVGIVCVRAGRAAHRGLIDFCSVVDSIGAEGQLVPAQKQQSLSFGGFPPLTTRERCLQGTSAAAGPLLTPATMSAVTLSDGGAVSAFLGVVADGEKCNCFY